MATDLGFEGEQFDNYVVKGKIGGGSYGTVHAVHDIVADTRLATKFVPIENNDQLVQGVLEVRTMASFDHPNVIKYITCLTVSHNGGRYLGIVTPLGACDVATHVEAAPPTPLQAARLIKQALEGLAYLHRRKFVHRDIKPQNMVVFDGDRLVLVDVGLATIRNQDSLASLAGTPFFIAPEFRTGALGAASDCFSAAVTLMWILVPASRDLPIPLGMLPEAARNELVDRLLEGLRDAPELIDVIKGLLKTAPEERMTAAAAAVMLDAFIIARTMRRIFSIHCAGFYLRVVQWVVNLQGAAAGVGEQFEMIPLGDGWFNIRPLHWDCNGGYLCASNESKTSAVAFTLAVGKGHFSVVADPKTDGTRFRFVNRPAGQVALETEWHTFMRFGHPVGHPKVNWHSGCGTVRQQNKVDTLETANVIYY